MVKSKIVIDVVDVTRKGEHIGYKVYINDLKHYTKFPRKPDDLNRQAHPGLLQPETEPIDYYTNSIVDSIVDTVQQALADWQIWVAQGYKPAGK